MRDFRGLIKESARKPMEIAKNVLKCHRCAGPRLFSTFVAFRAGQQHLPLSVFKLFDDFVQYPYISIEGKKYALLSVPKVSALLKREKGDV
jgi:hypothetical protein